MFYLCFFVVNIAKVDTCFRKPCASNLVVSGRKQFPCTEDLSIC